MNIYYKKNTDCKLKLLNFDFNKLNSLHYEQCFIDGGYIFSSQVNVSTQDGAVIRITYKYTHYTF